MAAGSGTGEVCISKTLLTVDGPVVLKVGRLNENEWAAIPFTTPPLGLLAAGTRPVITLAGEEKSSP
jgi:hypothetical protein